MSGTRMRASYIVAVTAVLFPHASARADYMAETVPLISQQFGVTAGTVVVQANDGTTAVNGVQPGQVSLTFAANPLSAYTQNGAGLGFTALKFSTDLSISQIVLPAGWFGEPAPHATPTLGSGISPPPTVWNLALHPAAPPTSSVTITLSGLGSSATPDHFLPPSFTLSGVLQYPGAGGTLTQDTIVATGVSAAPEPSTLAMAVAGVAGLVLARRRGRRCQDGHQGVPQR